MIELIIHVSSVLKFNLKKFCSNLCLVLPLLCSLCTRAPRVTNLGPTCRRLWRSGTPCATRLAALVGLFTGPREKNSAVVFLS